jgi:hypothetical protein
VTPAGFALHALLLQEPWCFAPDQVARLTAWQVEHLYLRPAAERAKQMKRPPLPADPPITDEATFVAVMQGRFGGDPEKWKADWARIQAAEGR